MPVKRKRWIQKAHLKEGALHKQLHIKAGRKIPVARLRAAVKKGGKLGKRAQFALNARKFHHPKGKRSRR
jgi:hypothetical protein